MKVKKVISVTRRYVGYLLLLWIVLYLYVIEELSNYCFGTAAVCLLVLCLVYAGLTVFDDYLNHKIIARYSNL